MKEIILDSFKEIYDIVLAPISDKMMEKVNELRANDMFKNDDTDNLVVITDDNSEELPCTVSHIFAIGNVMEIGETQLAKYIPSKDNKGSNFYCYPKKDFTGSNGIIVHDSATSAFYGALMLLKKPKYGIIYRRSKKEKLLTNIIMNSTPNNNGDGLLDQIDANATN